MRPYDQIYKTKEGNVFFPIQIHETFKQSISEEIGTKIILAGIVVSNIIKHSRNGKKFRVIKIEYRDCIETHVMFNDINFGKYKVCLFFGEIESYKNEKTFKIKRAEQLMTAQEIIKEFNKDE